MKTTGFPVRRLVRATSLIMVVAVTLFLFVWVNAQQKKAQEFLPDPITFALIDSTGKPVRAEDFRGQWLLIYTGYTFCPDVCPTELSHVRRVMNHLGKAGDQLQLLFISVDPARDTPQVLAGYLPFFHPRLRGLTGSTEAVTAAAKSLGSAVHVDAERGTGGHYTITHGISTYLVDPQGRPVWKFQAADGAEAVAKELARRIR